MRTAFLLLASALALPAAHAVAAEPVGAIAMHGEPALKPGYDHLPYANPDAPKGGEISYGVVGTFDSLNPFILKSMRTTARGIWDPEFGNLVYESLMQRSSDEPFTLYGLLARSVEMDDDRTFIEFHIDPKARWSDGVPVTADDVVFTFRLLQEKGRPPYSNRLDNIASMKKTGPLSVRFDLKKGAGREFPLILAMSPILPKHAIDTTTFGRSTLDIPIGSGPYRIASVDPGERIVFKRNPDYWGRNLPDKRGLDNYDRITVEYFLSQSSQFEAFKKGVFDVYAEGNPTKWARSFDFPAVHDGDVVKETFDTRTPSGMLGFVFNTRRKVFADQRVRHALTIAFDFGWVNRNLFDDAYKRTEDYWQGSSLSCFGVPADTRERQLLEPFPDAVDPDVMDGTYKLPVTDGSGRDRKVLRKAYDLLLKAGYHIVDEKMVDDRTGRQLAFQVMTQDAGQEKLALAYQRTLAALGIAMSVRTVDDAQYQQRSQTFDYDMIIKSYPSSLSPGSEEIGRWASVSRDAPGSFNYAGTASPAIDAMIKAMLAARSQTDFRDAVRALDRVLVSGYYVVPLYHIDKQWVAHWKHVRHPSSVPLYGYQLPTWWDANAGKHSSTASILKKGEK